MKSKLVFSTSAMFLGLLVFALGATPAVAQEGELKVVDEVIAHRTKSHLLPSTREIEETPDHGLEY